MKTSQPHISYIGKLIEEENIVRRGPGDQGCAPLSIASHYDYRNTDTKTQSDASCTKSSQELLKLQ